MKDIHDQDAAGAETRGDDSAEGLDRRDFIKTTAAAFVLPFVVGVTNRAAEAASAAPTMIGAYVRVNPDNSITVVIGSTEMGQGIMTGLAQLVGEELQVNWAQVHAEHALASALWPNPYGNPIFGAQVTGGSTSMMGWYLPMRTAAAIVRDTLLAAANKKYGGTWTLAQGGMVTNGTVNHEFSDLLDVVGTITPPTTATLGTTTKFIGKNMQRLDIPSKVNGSAVFGMDVKVPGMMFGAIINCPTFGGTVSKMPTRVANATLVNLTNAVGVIATDTWTAMNAARNVAGNITWKPPADTSSADSAHLETVAQGLLTSTTVVPFIGEQAGTPDPGTAANHVDATYSLPFLVHAAMEVMNCTASVTATSCEIWAPTQGQQFIAPVVQALTGLTPDKVTVHTTFLGGGFGRKIESDYVSQAVLMSKAIGKPVKLIWSREQDFTHDMYRPKAVIRVQAGANSSGVMTDLVYRNVSASINLQRGYTNSQNPEDTGALSGAVGMPYLIARKRIEFVALQPCDVPLGYWRSVGESYNTFAVESAVDELALKAGKDPIAFRKSSMSGTGSDPRAIGVLNAVQTLSGWGTAPAAGHARGVAFLKGFGSYIAVVAEVSKKAAGEIHVNKFSIAIDCGTVVNPNQVTAQMQGGLLHGLSAAMWHQQTFINGKAQISNFNRYPIVKINQAPDIAVKIVTSTEAPGGVGETGVPCVAPAIANAWAKLTGVRLRTLPFYPGRTMGDG
jgi:isoquinoline 1-oxidoreductase beta subunit